MPKIHKMPQPKERRKLDGNPERERPSLDRSGILLGFPSQEEADLEIANRWVKLADQVLGNEGNKRKTA